MSEAKEATIKIVKPAKPKPQVRKFKLEEVKPSDIVEVWQLYRQSLDKAPPNYPFMAEEPDTFVRSQVFNMISQPNFLGVVAKVGRRPVGQLNGFVTHRPYGAPRVFFQFWLCWVDPDFRGSDLGAQMRKDLFKRLKAMGVFNFESIIDPAMVPVMEKVYGGQLAVVSHRIIGKVKVE